MHDQLLFFVAAKAPAQVPSLYYFGEFYKCLPQNEKMAISHFYVESEKKVSLQVQNASFEAVHPDWERHAFKSLLFLR